MYNKGRGNKSLDGTGFLIDKKHTGKIRQYVGISERVGLMILEINSMTSLKIIQIYTPTPHDDEIEKIYKTVTKALEKTKSHTLLVGDFNPVLGKNRGLRE